MYVVILDFIGAINKAMIVLNLQFIQHRFEISKKPNAVPHRRQH